MTTVNRFMPSPSTTPTRTTTSSNATSKSLQARHAFAVGERVEAHWQKKWWPAVVHGLEDDGRYEVHWEGDGRYDYVAAKAVRAVPSGSAGFLGRIFGK